MMTAEDLSVTIDLRWLHRAYRNSPIGAVGGVGSFARTLWSGLARRRPRIALTALVERAPLPTLFQELIDQADGATLRPAGLSGLLPRLDPRGTYTQATRVIETHLRAGMGVGRPAVLHMIDHTPPPRWLRCPTVCSIHEVPVAPGTALLQVLARMLPPTARATVVAFNSHAVARAYAAVARRPHEIIHLGIDTGIFTPEPSDADAHLPRRLRDRPYFVHAGILSGRKNPIGLLEAFGRVVREHPAPVALVSVGPYQVDPGALQTLRALANGAGIGDRLVVMENGASPHQLAALYRGSAGLVFPSLIEGFGLPPLEALACGVGCIIGDTGGLIEVVGALAIVVDPRDPRAIADGMLHLLRDPGTRARARCEGPHWAMRFSIDAMVDAYLRCYERAIGIASGLAS